MKILMLFHDFDVIGLLFHDFDVIWSVIPWFWRHRSVNHVISFTNHIYHGSYSWTYLNQLILRIRWFKHRRLCRVKTMLAMYLKYHKAGLTPTTPVTSIAISPVKMSIGRKSLTNLHSEMIFPQGKPVFYIFLPSTPPCWQIILRLCWQWTPMWQQSENRPRATYFRLSVVLGFYHCLTKHTWNVQKEKFGKRNYI